MTEVWLQTAMAPMKDVAAQAARFVRNLANERRLMVLCRLASAGEMSVTALAEAVGLSQSALSQHLARLRQDGLVSFRREAQTLFYRLADGRTRKALAVLSELFCDQRCGSTGEQDPRSR